MKRYDTIIIGAGHNGLVCASYLANAGQHVLVLESASAPGGLAANRAFHEDFSAPVAHSVGHFSRKIADDLKLASHGFEGSPQPPALTALDPAGDHVSVRGTEVMGVSAEDLDAWPEFAEQMKRFAETLAPFWLRTIPRVANTGLGDLTTFAQIGLKLRLLGRDEMREFLRIAALPARDLADERFANELLRTLVCWDGLIGSKLAPRSPNNAVLPMLYRMGGGLSGQPSRLVDALVKAATASGVDIRTRAAVDRISVDGGTHGLRAKGVRLADGESIDADRVVSSADPQTTFFRLLGAEHLEIEFSNRIRRLRCHGYVAKLHLALDGLPAITGLDRLEGRLLIAPCMDAIEFAFDDAKYGECSKEPVMEITVPSLDDASLAPPGRHVLSAHLMYVPYRTDEGWNAAARDDVRERAIAWLARYAPGIQEQIIHAEVLTPWDMEQIHGVSGGHWHHTEFALDQALMMRPTYGAAQYATPLPGLFLCGAGSHPGGDLTGAPGHNAAQEILRR